MPTAMKKAEFLFFCKKLILFALAFTAGFALIELYVPLKHLITGSEQDWNAILQEVNFRRYFILLVVLAYLYAYSNSEKDRKRRGGSFKE
jgi:hypothetical protein